MSSNAKRLDSVERGTRECLWASQLTQRRKLMGTTACWKRRDCPKACRVRVRQGLRDTANATLRELQDPAMQPHIPRNHAWRGHRLTADYVVAAGTLGRWAEVNETSQGTERSAYVTLLQLAFENMRSPTGREPYGDGASIVVRGRESRPHGEARQVFFECHGKGGTRDA
jgi:hypothetical protein